MYLRGVFGLVAGAEIGGSKVKESVETPSGGKEGALFTKIEQREGREDDGSYKGEGAYKKE